ncbi:U2A'/phosphoprotein 32 family A C-terminal domain-containing protein [Plasmodiophora brassicae]|uniref:U2A'/phosphoprotein 32 family A C-terminal domain-containing protein n=1 Tax=Plasmodiophora brassicae TaxID=37360 RepID=A0A0G4IIR9_PLABS|nr:hypothetical protein PBRA_003833 [Plasmodiophora brassicae]SPQ94348.1 unnamed protein product [Plasmodiophora brassicae]
MRLTAETIQEAPAFINAVLERELNLRGLKIPAVESLGATQDQFDAIDLSDNDIIKLENFPILKRCKSLIVNNNRIRRIAPGLGRALPSLQTLVLTNNQLARLQDLDPLHELKGLERLSLLKNPVTALDNYRLYVISMFPKLRHLDFQKVQVSERERATAMFQGRDRTGTRLDHEEDAELRQLLTPEVKKLIKIAIDRASSLDEINRLEAILVSGRISEGDLAMLKSSAAQPQTMQTE